MSDAIQVRTLHAVGEREIQGLSDVLIDCVEGGASVSFMLPIDRATAVEFWRGVAAGVERRCGVIPGYALLPGGGLCDTTFFYRTL